MALTLEELSYAINLGDGETEIEGPEATVLQRLLNAMTAVVTARAPSAPDDVKDQAVVLLVRHAWDFDTGFGSDSFRRSGAFNLLRPWMPLPAYVISNEVV